MPTQAELRNFIESLHDRGLLKETGGEVDWDFVIWDYMRTRGISASKYTNFRSPAVKCDKCGCEPAVIYRDNKGAFCPSCYRIAGEITVSFRSS